MQTVLLYYDDAADGFDDECDWAWISDSAWLHLIYCNKILSNTLLRLLFFVFVEVTVSIGQTGQGREPAVR